MDYSIYIIIAIIIGVAYFIYYRINKNSTMHFRQAEEFIIGLCNAYQNEAEAGLTKYIDSHKASNNCWTFAVIFAGYKIAQLNFCYHLKEYEDILHLTYKYIYKNADEHMRRYILIVDILDIALPKYVGNQTMDIPRTEKRVGRETIQDCIVDKRYYALLRELSHLSLDIEGNEL